MSSTVSIGEARSTFSRRRKRWRNARGLKSILDRFGAGNGSAVHHSALIAMIERFCNVYYPAVPHQNVVGRLRCR
ncbi:MAG: hypothetical protein CMJ81_19305 [Planctomycetaceae bacterium]|nr:hypothetical protein [Planctomycetaceae bacterium]MBP60094.1 hypothetical protein [Planctomycetaceae bacterium]